jgi:hypothetical protein
MVDADCNWVPLYACGMIRQMRDLVSICVALSVASFGALPVPSAHCAQQETTSPVSIRVTDPSGASIPHVTISVVPSPDPSPAKMETDEAGQLSLNLSAGSYALFADAPGFKAAATQIDVQGTNEVQIVPVRLEIRMVNLMGGSPQGFYIALATPSTMPMGTLKLTTPTDELRVSAYTKQEGLELKAADLKSMPRTTVTVHNEHSKADETYVGVRLADLLGKLGAPLGHDLRGVALSAYIVATGSDGYVAVIALAEVDPSFHSGEVLVADTMNGQPLDEKSGPFKLVVTEDKRPARWVRNLVSIELKSAK